MGLISSSLWVQHPPGVPNIMNCELCKSKIDGSFGTGRFCNRSCAAKFSTNINRDERNKKISASLLRKTSLKKRCKNCNKEFVVCKTGGTTRCNDCKYYNRNSNPDFSLIRQDGTRRIHLIRERGHECEVCKNKLWMGKPIPLELDHIDGDCRNNGKSNLRLICPNCHAQTDTYKGKNVGRIKNSERQQVLKKHPIAKYR